MWLLLSVQLFLSVLLFSAPAVYGWGKQGHQIVGNIAWMLLTEETRYNVSNLLNVINNRSECHEFCSPLAIVADWADEIRYRYHWSAALHYIDVRDDLLPGGCHRRHSRTPQDANEQGKKDANNLCQFNYTRDCPKNVCVAGAIVNYTARIAVLTDHHRDTPTTALWQQQQQQKERRESLMFVTHFVGDIHQPLHCARQTDRGGNSIHVHYDVKKRFRDESSSTEGDTIPATTSRRRRHRRRLLLRGGHQALNLHAVWDDSIIETTLAHDYKHSRNAMEANLLRYIWQVRTTDAWQKLWLSCPYGSRTECTVQWAEESWEYAIQYAYSHVNGTEIVDGAVLDVAYYESRLPVVRERLAVAAVRLALTLEDIFRRRPTSTVQDVEQLDAIRTSF